MSYTHRGAKLGRIPLVVSHLGLVAFLLLAALPYVHALSPQHDENACPGKQVVMAGAVLVPIIAAVIVASCPVVPFALVTLPIRQPLLPHAVRARSPPV